jgi:predicted nucleotide-binding protein
MQREYERWVEKVANWLEDLFPDSGLSADWSSLPKSNLSFGGFVSTNPDALLNFFSVVQKRLSWLSTLARSAQSVPSELQEPGSVINPSRKVFIVHGHDHEILQKVARFLEKLDLRPIILHEQPSEGKTIIEKFVTYSDVFFSIVLLTDDDIGGPQGTDYEDLKPRARQNVLFELGFFIGKLGRNRVCAIYKEGVEIPTDYKGVIYIKYSSDNSWKLNLAKEMKASKLPVDLNKAI